uniref:NADH-quinone oxidoreductase subunit I n=1 Tax=Paulinella micropora TaxID=1928728 RepID=A0A385I022_9EUKA|nr:NADH dehydrogenase subunit I [Paulinella micropora]AXY63267.1 NADH dehydrogenase subunit I [Paulinella micropora]
MSLHHSTNLTSFSRDLLMLGFLRQVGDYTRDTVDAARNIAQGLAVTFDHFQRRPVTVQYPYEKLIPSPRYRGRIHYEIDKCIACEVCVKVCPINLPIVDYEPGPSKKIAKVLRNYSIDFGVCIFCANCVEYCPTQCLSMTEEYELTSFDRHNLNYDSVALGRLPTTVSTDPSIRPLRELAELPKGELDPHNVPVNQPAYGPQPKQVLNPTMLS